jgi:hypothetical protein
VSSTYTTLLGLVQPTTGELTNTWGTVVNAQLTQLVEDSIAQYSQQDITAADWSLTTTAGGAANQARTAILIVIGTPGTTRYINAPQQSKTYVVINNCSDSSSVYIRGGPTSPTTGVEIEAGSSALVAWDSNTSDFIKVAGGGGGASGGAGNPIVYENDITISVDYTITTNKNAMSAGPLTLNSGITVTVPSGSTWVVL